MPALDVLADVARFVHFVDGGVDAYCRAALAVAPQGFAEAVAVLCDDGVGSIKDGLGGAVVLFETDGGERRKIAFQLQDVFDTRAAPAVDGLVVITDDEQLRPARAELLYQAVLQGVGVLKFVHQHALKTLLIVLQHLGVVGEELNGQQQQFGKIHRALLAAKFFVVVVELANGQLPRMRRRRHVFGAQAFFFISIDLPDHVFRLHHRFIPLARAHHPLYQTQLVVAVHDDELLRPLHQRRVTAQDAVANAVKSPHPQLPQRALQRRFQPLSHFTRCLVGKGQRQEAVRRHALNRHQPLHALHQHARLAATRSGNHPHGARRMGDRFALALVQALQYFADIHCFMSPKLKSGAL